MTKTELIKWTTSIVVGAGTGKIVGQIIKNNTDPQNIVDTTTMFAAAWVLGAMAADATKTYTDAKIDEIAAWWEANVTNRPDTV